MRVLLIDDERELVSTLCERLALRGIQADWAADGQQGLAMAEQTDYQWAVIDLKMPGLDGRRVIELIKQKRPGIKIILVSGHSVAGELEACPPAGADCFLVKPFELEELMAKLRGEGGD